MLANQLKDQEAFSRVQVWYDTAVVMLVDDESYTFWYSIIGLRLGGRSEGVGDTTERTLALTLSMRNTAVPGNPKVTLLSP